MHRIEVNFYFFIGFYLLIFLNFKVLFNFIMSLDYYLENYEEICKDSFDLIQTIPPLSLVYQKQSTIEDIFSNSNYELLYIKLIN